MLIGLGVSLFPASVAPLGFASDYEEPIFCPSSKYPIGFQTHLFAFLHLPLFFPFLSVPHPPSLPLSPLCIIRAKRGPGARGGGVLLSTRPTSGMWSLGPRMAVGQGNKVNGSGRRQGEPLRGLGRSGAPGLPFGRAEGGRGRSVCLCPPSLSWTSSVGDVLGGASLLERGGGPTF